MSFAAAALLAGCGGSQLPIGAPGAASHVSAFGAHSNSTNYKVVYSFSPPPDGVDPTSSLADVDGTLYGTTAQGGSSYCGGFHCGTVFSMTTSGEETVLHSFTGGSADGASPRAALLNVNGTLYGTTQQGGSSSSCGSGCGTVFSITTSGKETVLYSFKGGKSDGQNPFAGLINVAGKLYGTTWQGGSSSCGGAGCGTVFSITTSGKETVLYGFKGGKTDGQNPYAGLINVAGKLYGTTVGGGSHCRSGVGCGTVFTVTTSGKEAVLYSFKGGKTDGQDPYAGLIYVKGRLYGTTTGGGAYCRSSGGCGTVFATTLAGAETVLHSFGHRDDGSGPRARLLDFKGTLYGTTLYGGKYAYNYYPGTVFKISTSGTERVLHSFNGDGDEPAAGLISVEGTLYGTTEAGGAGYCYSGDDSGCGTIFALQP